MECRGQSEPGRTMDCDGCMWLCLTIMTVLGHYGNTATTAYGCPKLKLP